MNYLTIKGLKPYDGSYEFDLAENAITTREWGWIKRLTGYLPLTMSEGLDGGDPELYAAFAAIALCRAGKIEPAAVPDVYDRICDRPFDPDSVSLDSDDEDEVETDAGPPPPSSSGNGGSSGPGSRTNSETLAAIPPVSGTAASDTSGSRSEM